MKLYRYQFRAREGLLLQMGDGWGEIAPLPGFSHETLDEATQEILAHFDQSAPITLPSVQWGVSCAEIPYDASPFSIPLCAFKKPFPNATHLKLKLGSLPLEEGIALTKQYVGKYKLRIDCNQAWTLEQALYFASHFQSTDFDYLEEPLKNFDHLIQFSQKTHFPIAVDESFRVGLPYLEIPTLRAVVIKPMLTGFIPKIDYPVVISSSFETSLGIALIARCGSPQICHGLHTFEDDLLSPALRADNGQLHVPKHVIQTEKLWLIASRN